MAPTHAHAQPRAKGTPPRGPLGVYFIEGHSLPQYEECHVQQRQCEAVLRPGSVCCGQNRPRLKHRGPIPIVLRGARTCCARAKMRVVSYCGECTQKGALDKNGAWRGHMPIVGARGTPKKGQNKKIGFAKESTCAHHLVPRPYHAQIWPRSLRPRKYLRAPSLVPHPKSPPHIGTQKSRQSKNDHRPKMRVVS